MNGDDTAASCVDSADDAGRDGNRDPDGKEGVLGPIHLHISCLQSDNMSRWLVPSSGPFESINDVVFSSIGLTLNLLFNLIQHKK